MTSYSLPDRIGRYEIVREIGRGGMGVVYEAWDAAFDRAVALKVLPREAGSDSEMYARFQREAKLIAALEHEAIVPVYDYGEDGGRPYFVMRLMSGGSLADRMRDRKLTADEAVTLVEELAPALDKAHSRSIIHRDLKPGNILFDDNGLAYLSDFGIAKLVASGQAAMSQVLGTPAYMSPEQVQGSGPLDGRSDLYSLGVILWETLTGAVPYQAETPIQMALKHTQEPIPALRELHPELPKALEGIMTRVLAKQPEDRFPNAAAFARALRAAIPAAASPPVPPTLSDPRTPTPRPTPTTGSGGVIASRATPLPPSGVAQKRRRVALLALVPLIALIVIGGAMAFSRSRGSGDVVAPDPEIVTAVETPADKGAALATRTVRPTPGTAGTRVPSLPTAPSVGGGADVTSTAIPVLATSTAAPTLTRAATAGGTDTGGLRLTASSPREGARISGALTIQITVAGGNGNERGELWMGGEPLYRVSQMSRSGNQLTVTVPVPPNGNYGNWRWQARLYSGSTQVTTSAVQALFWTAPAVPVTNTPPPAGATATLAVPTVTAAPDVTSTPFTIPTIPNLPTIPLPPTPVPGP